MRIKAIFTIDWRVYIMARVIEIKMGEVISVQASNLLHKLQGSTFVCNDGYITSFILGENDYELERDRVLKERNLMTYGDKV